LKQLQIYLWKVEKEIWQFVKKAARRSPEDLPGGLDGTQLFPTWLHKT
jgi:hypothetical protein